MKLFATSFDNKVGELKRVREKSTSFEVNEYLVSATVSDISYWIVANQPGEISQ